jgi:hypothetical protein
MYHGPINYKDTKTKCRLYWCLIEFIDWRYSLSCWYFRPSFVNYCIAPLAFSLVHLPPFPNPKCSIYRQCVAGMGLGVLSCVGDHILHSVADQIQNLQKLLYLPKEKPRRGVGSQTDKHLLLGWSRKWLCLLTRNS